LAPSDQSGQLVFIGAVMSDAAEDGVVLPRNCTKQPSAQSTVRHVRQETDKVGHAWVKFSVGRYISGHYCSFLPRWHSREHALHCSSKRIGH
ncbi:unnamed protein product, partial [Aphanomyces euteiches]